MYVEWGIGKYDNPLPPPGDMYMVVNLDADGIGTYTVYDHVLDEFMVTTCTADEYGIYADEDGGVYSYGLEPPQAYEWALRFSSDESDLIETYASFIDYEEDEFRFSLYLKPWGDDWQSETEDGGLLPPGFDDYLDKIRKGEPSPFAGGGIVSSDTNSNEDAVDTGASNGAEDVILDARFNYDNYLDTFEKAGFTTDKTTVEEIRAFFGIEGRMDPDWSSDKFAIKFFFSDEGYITVFFNKDSKLYTSSSASGYGKP
jgi:hypothetical protein